MSFLTAASGYTPVRFDDMAYVLTAKKNVLVQAGVIVPSRKMNQLMSNGGVIFDLPFWNDVANVADRISNSTSIPNLFSGGAVYPTPEGLTSSPLTSRPSKSISVFFL